MRSPGCPGRRKGSGALKEEIGVWNSQGGGKNKHFYSLVRIIEDMFLLPENLLTNPVILKCI